MIRLLKAPGPHVEMGRLTLDLPYRDLMSEWRIIVMENVEMKTSQI